MTPPSSLRPERKASRLALTAGFAAIYLFWGGTFLAIRYAVMEVPPLLTIAVRCVGGAAILYAFLLWRGGLERVTLRHWLTSGVAGAFLFVGCHSVLAWAEQRVSSGQAALYLTSITFWLVVLASVRERRAPDARVLAGLALGIVGVSILVSGRSTGAETLLDKLILIGTGLSWAIGSLIARHGARPSSVVQSTAMQLAAGGAVVLVLSLLGGEWQSWGPQQITPRGAASLGFLVVAGTVLGFGAYTWLLQVTTPAAVGTYSFVNPVVALALAWMVGDEAFSIRTVVAAGFVLVAVGLIWRSSSSAPKPQRSFASRRMLPYARGQRVVSR